MLYAWQSVLLVCEHVRALGVRKLMNFDVFP